MKDWYHNQSQVNLDWYLSKANLDGNEPTPSKWICNQRMGLIIN